MTGTEKKKKNTRKNNDLCVELSSVSRLQAAGCDLRYGLCNELDVGFGKHWIPFIRNEKPLASKCFLANELGQRQFEGGVVALYHVS